MRAKLLSGLEVKEARNGHVLVEEGSQCNGFIVVFSGEAVITHMVQQPNTDEMMPVT